MKKFTAALCTVLLLIGAVLVPGAAAAGPALANTRAYCIMDADTGLVLAQQNMDEELHPASITKVMTLGLACEKAQGDWDDVPFQMTVHPLDAVGEPIHFLGAENTVLHPSDNVPPAGRTNVDGKIIFVHNAPPVWL